MTSTETTRPVLNAFMIGYLPLLAVCCLVALIVGFVLIVVGSTHSRLVAVFCFFVPAAYLLLMVGHVVVAVSSLFEDVPGKDEMELTVPDDWMGTLYEFVESVAEKRGLPKPDEIRLHAFSLAHVYENDDRRKILVIGGLALASFTQTALAGVVAHELGHFHGGDTSLSRKSAKWMRMMDILEHRFAEDNASTFNLMIWMLRGYHCYFRRAWAENSRAEEFAADAYEIEHVGPEQTARTTILISAVDHLPYVELKSVAQWCVEMRMPMTRVFTEQAARARPTSADDWERAFRKAAKTATKPLDTHPCMKERLKATKLPKKKCVELARGLNAEGEPATDLVQNWEAIEKVLSSKVGDVVQDLYEDRREAMQVFLGRPL